MLTYFQNSQGGSFITPDATGGEFQAEQFLESDAPFRRIVSLFPAPLTEVALSNCHFLDPFSSRSDVSSECFKIGGGSLTVSGSFPHPFIFHSSLKDGFVGLFSFTFDGLTQGETFIAATLLPNPKLGIAGGTLSGNWSWISTEGGPRQFQFSFGSGIGIGVTVVPEPGTLGLLGTGLIGLAGMVRRKLE